VSAQAEGYHNQHATLMMGLSPSNSCDAYYDSGKRYAALRLPMH